MGKIPNDYIVLLHARIKTHGSISEKMFTGGTVMIGILPQRRSFHKNKGDLTDSETFFRYLFLPAFGETDIEETNEGIDDMVNSVIGSSKFVFGKRKMLFYGNFERPDKNKFAYFSNNSYQKKNIVTALFMVMRFTMTAKPDILNIPIPTITQKILLIQ